MIDKQKVKLINKCICKIAKGDTEALEILFKETYRYFFVVASSYLDNKDQADDVLSIVYYKVVMNAKNFDSQKNGYNWIFEIVKNTALNENKSNKRKQYEELEKADSQPYEIVDDLLNRIMVDEAKSFLNEDEKILIYSYYYENKSLQEIADSLHKPKATVYYTLKKILEKIQKYLN